MHKKYSRLGLIGSLTFHVMVFGVIWGIAQMPKPIVVSEELTSISIEMLAARLEQPQVATSLDPSEEEVISPEKEIVPEKQEPELEKEIQPDPIPAPIPEPKQEEKPKPKPKEKSKEKEKPKEKQKEKEKPKEKEQTKEKAKEKPQKIKAIEKGTENKQGIVAKAIPNAYQGIKEQAGIPNGAEKGSNSQSGGHSTGHGSGASSDEINAYKAKLQRALQQKANSAYPQREKMMRKTGTVTLRFSLSSSGSISNVVVLKSSGNDNLDKAAIKAAESTKPPAPPKGFPSLLEVPVRFSVQ